MYTCKRFQVQEWICNQQKYFWLEILLSSSSCNIIFDKEFRDHVFWYMCTCFLYVEVGKYVCKYFDTFTNLRIN